MLLLLFFIQTWDICTHLNTYVKNAALNLAYSSFKTNLSQFKPASHLKHCSVWTWTLQHWITGSTQPKLIRNVRTEMVLVQPVWICSGGAEPQQLLRTAPCQSPGYVVHMGFAFVFPSSLQAPLLHFSCFHCGRQQSWVHHMEQGCVCLYTYAIKTVIWNPAVSLWFPHGTNEKGFLNSVILNVIKAERKINSQLVDRCYMYLI